MTTLEDIEKFNNQYLVYSAKNILREAAFMLPIFCISIFYNGTVTWKGVLFVLVSSLSYGFFNIALQRYLHKKGKISIPPSPKFGHKTWKQHQEDKKTKD